MKIIMIALISFLSINQAVSQKSEKDILDKFFEIYKTDPAKALDYIYGTTEWIDSEGDGVKKLKDQLTQYKELLGEYQEEEFLHKGDLGKDFTIYIYFAKYDRQPLRFTFQFYRPKDEWIVYSFKFDDNFNDDLEELLKYEYIPNKF